GPAHAVSAMMNTASSETRCWIFIFLSLSEGACHKRQENIEHLTDLTAMSRLDRYSVQKV
ncbi:MAG: hypothetical protein ACM3QS_07485, partial [Bacteroidota bacterium]